MNFKLLSNRGKILTLEPGVFSFINLYSLRQLIKTKNETGFLYAVDGGLLCTCFKYFYKLDVERMSFDFTSLANDVFEKCVEKNYSVAFVGGTEEDNVVFTQKIKKLYPEIKITLTQHGYYLNSRVLSESIMNSEVRVVLLGLGSDKQDIFAQELLNQGFEGCIFTCGGFMTQTANTKRLNGYYPAVVEQLKLRALYRFFYEKHTRKRYLIDYPLCLITLFINIFSQKLKFNVL